MALMQAAKHLGHQQAFDGGQHADAHLRRCARFTAQAAHAVAQGLHAGPGVMHEAGAGRGQLDALAAALEQARLEQVFKLLEGLGNCRLADRQNVGGPGQAALPGNLQEAQQVAVLDAGVEVHAPSLPHRHLWRIRVARLAACGWRLAACGLRLAACGFQIGWISIRHGGADSPFRPYGGLLWSWPK
ncbi:hypothetical protein D3C73_1082990 [compost metagenome]